MNKLLSILSTSFLLTVASYGGVAIAVSYNPPEQRELSVVKVGENYTDLRISITDPNVTKVKVYQSEDGYYYDQIGTISLEGLSYKSNIVYHVGPLNPGSNYTFKIREVVDTPNGSPLKSSVKPESHFSVAVVTSPISTNTIPITTPPLKLPPRLERTQLPPPLPVITPLPEGVHYILNMPPFKVKATVLTPTSIDLNWDNREPDDMIESNTIEESMDGVKWYEIDTIPRNNHYLVTDLEEGKQYYYKVRSNNRWGSSRFSDDTGTAITPVTPQSKL